MNYILHGQDTNRISQKINALKIKYRISDNVIVFDATNTEQDVILNEIDSLSIFDDRKMIIVQNSSFLSSKDSTKYDVDQFLKRSSNDDMLIIVYCVSSDKLDTRKKVVKAMIEKSTVYPCVALDEKSQAIYINEQLKKMDIQMDLDAKKWFISRVGLDALKIDQELYKLKTYSNHLGLDDVKELTSVEPLNDVFKMVDALFEKNALRLLAYYRNFRMLNMEPVAINGLLSSQIRFLFQVRVLIDQSMNKEEIASKLKAHPYRVQVNMQKAYAFSADELLEKLSLLAALDQNMKMGLIDKDDGFEQFILEMLR